MTKDKKQLMDEIDKLQNFINLCENAKRFGLGLDEATHDKYTDAVARQKELGHRLEAMEGSDRGIFTSAQLLRKEPQLHTDKCRIEAVVELDRSAFWDFRNHLYDNQEFIKEHRDLMYQDKDGVSHCLLVLGEGEADGVLVESEGSLYARYSALLPNARDFIQKHIQTMAEEIIRQGAAQTDSGKWVISFEEISQHFDCTVTPTNTLGQMLIREMEDRNDVANLVIAEDLTEMTCYLDHAPASATAAEKITTLFGLMGCNLEDVHIVDADVDHELATVVELNQDTLTEEGKAEWADVLNAKVLRIFDGCYGIHIEVTGCEASRVQDFSMMLAGYCPASEYDRWVRQEEAPANQNAPTLTLGGE